jgi:UDP-2,4-diacetamido-2,4,6-trideoxy-beta-L-altropyranose hydrolase
MKNIIFRVDSSNYIGTGHLMRCLVLADKLKQKDCNCIFICKDLEGNLNKLVCDNNYILYQFENNYNIWLNDAIETKNIIKDIGDIHYLIIDNYNLEIGYEYQFKRFVNKIMVIDDLGRKHYYDILLDNNISKNNYINKILYKDNYKLFLGLDYLLLRDEFIVAKNKIRNRDRGIKNILISFGGSDPFNETLKVLEGLKPLNNIDINVVVGNSNINKNIIKQVCETNNYNYYEQIDNIAELINKADLAIGAGGVSLWERCYLGCPSIVTILAENQRQNIEEAEKLNCVINMGWFENTKPEYYYNVVKNIDTLELEYMSNNCLKLFSNNKIDEVINEIVRD